MLCAFFFKFICMSWIILCAISRSTCFAVSYSGSLDRMLSRIKLGQYCATYSRKIAVIYTSLAWILVLTNYAFLVYSFFFTGGYMDILLAPITTNVNLSHLLFPRIVVFLFCSVYTNAAWIFPHALSFMLATIFTHQYKQLSSRLGKTLEEGDERRVSDSDIEIFRQQHQTISMSVSRTDDFLMFHNAGAFCVQLFNVILFLYDFLFFRSSSDPVVIIMRVFWTFGTVFGLSVTAAGGIMVNHYVSTKLMITAAD